MSVKGRRVPVIDRILARCTEDVDGCWIWQGYTHKGYGQITLSFEDGRRLTHRLTYEHFIGPIPTGLELDHTCRRPACCNPWHLDPVTHAVNVRRAEQHGLRAAAFRAKTHCRNGHAYSAANTHTTPTGTRRCRTCSAASARRARSAA